MKRVWMLVAVMVVGLVGCGKAKKPVAVNPPPASPPAMTVQPVGPLDLSADPAPAIPVPTPSTPAASPSTTVPSTDPPPPTALTGKRRPQPTDPNAAPATAGEVSAPVGLGEEAVAADVGVGIKGRSLDDYEGAVVTPAKAFFAAREIVAFRIAIPSALNTYEALNGDIKTHEEFMEKIIAENNIKLPELPTDARYHYNVEKKELEVIRQRKN